MNKKPPIATILFCLIIITATFNLFFKYSFPESYVQGWLVDYLLPKFYLSDIFILIFISHTIYLIFRGKIQIPGFNFHQYLLAKNKTKITSKSNITSEKPTTKKIKNCYQLLVAHLTPLLLLILIIIFIYRQFYTPVPLAAFYSLAKIGEWVLFGGALLLQRAHLRPKPIFYTFFFLSLFHFSLSLFQFITQKPLFPYQILGETNLARPLGLTKGTFPLFNSQPLVLPYSSFPHPNILAGWLVLSFLFCSQILLNMYTKLISKNSKKSQAAFTPPIAESDFFTSHPPHLIQQYFPAHPALKLQLFLTPLAQSILLIQFFLTLIILYLTQSWSADLTLIFGLFWLSWQKKHFFKAVLQDSSKCTSYKLAHTINSSPASSPHSASTPVLFYRHPSLSLWLPFISILIFTPMLIHLLSFIYPNQTSFTRRDFLNQTALKIISSHPLDGTGLNQFVPDLPFHITEPITFHQPVHHTLLLIWAEIGLLGTSISALLINLFLQLKKTNPAINFSISQIIIPLLILSPILVLDHYLLTTQVGNLLFLSTLLFLTQKHTVNAF